MNTRSVRTIADIARLAGVSKSTRELIRVANDTRVSSDTMIELLGRIETATEEWMTLVLDNARYQRCERFRRKRSGWGSSCCSGLATRRT